MITPIQRQPKRSMSQTGFKGTCQLLRAQRALVGLALLGLFALFLGAWAGTFPALADEPARLHEARFTYRLDYSRVPSWVTVREVTLLVDVGPALDVVAFGDGHAIPCSYDGQRALITTDAQEVEVIVSAPSRSLGEMGRVSIATLRDDKLWAFSLTFDDGYAAQATTARELLERYGYKGTIAVIGSRIGKTIDGDAYATAEQLQAAVNAGWWLSNHSYSHKTSAEIGDEAAILRDLLAANRAITTAVPGHMPIVFTNPYTDPGFTPVVRKYVDELGLRLVQTTHADHIPRVDPGVFRADDRLPYVLGRDALPQDGSYFDAVHRMVSESPGTHRWLSLHDHLDRVDVACSCAETAIDALYRTYGAGGTDEVWVAPAPVVYQYLIVRDRVAVTEVSREMRGEPPAGFVLPTPSPTPMLYTLTLQQGANYAGVKDAYITSYAPNTNYERGSSATGLIISSPDVPVSSLLRFELGQLPPSAIVKQALLRLYGLERRNTNAFCIEAYALSRDWDDASVTWVRPRPGELWGSPGADAPGVDRTATHSGARALVDGVNKWYDLDLTDLVQQWIANPESNKGLLLKGQGASNHVALASSQYPDTRLHPALIITYNLPTAEPVITPGQGDASLMGRVLFEGRGSAPSPTWRVPITITIQREEDATPVWRGQLATGPYGEFLIEDLPPGVYSVSIASAHALRAIRRNLHLRPGPNTMTVGPLVEGDIVPDGYITARDRSVLVTAFGSTAGETNYVAQADLNDDGRINVQDLTLLESNYGRYGDVVQFADSGSQLFLPYVRASRRVSSSPRSLAMGRGQGWAEDPPLSLPIVGHSPLLPFPTPTLWAGARDVRVRGRYAYMVVATYGQDPGKRFVYVLDVQQPHAPTLVNTYSGLAWDPDEIRLDGDRAYVAKKGNGVDILDISNPPAITFLGNFAYSSQPPQSPIAKGVYPLGNLMYVAAEWDGLQIVDVSNPARPALLGEWTRSAFGEGVWSDGQVAYMAASHASGYAQVRVFDVSDPRRPFKTAYTTTPVRGSAVDLTVSDGYLYVAAEEGGVLVFDVASNPWEPELKGAFSTFKAQKLAVVERIVYVADYEEGLKVIDATNPAAMRLIAQCDTPGLAWGVSVANGYAYVADGREGLQVIDLAPLTPSPTPTPTYTETPSPSPTPTLTATPSPTSTPTLVRVGIPLVMKRSTR